MDFDSLPPASESAPRTVQPHSPGWDREKLEGSSKQLLEHWQRCGATSVPKGHGNIAENWLREHLPNWNHTVSDWLPDPNEPPTDSTSSNSAPVIPPKANFPSKMDVKSSSATNTILGNKLADDELWCTPSLEGNERVQVFADLQMKVSACTLCASIVCQRKQAVFGEGSVTPRVVFFGEAPGAEEDRQGRPFVGPAGQLLDRIITASQMRREDVYILNSLKCRPPSNRTPVETEIENCRPFFEMQLEILQPEYIVCLGAVAVRAVLQSTAPVGRLRGRFHRYRQAKVLVTYHPSYLLRTESAKKLTWEDMQMLMKDMGVEKGESKD